MLALAVIILPWSRYHTTYSSVPPAERKEAPPRGGAPLVLSSSSVTTLGQEGS